MKSTRTAIGSAGGSNFATDEMVTWTVPDSYRVITLYCNATVTCHANITNEEVSNGALPAMVTAKIEGYDGSAWVTLAQSSTGYSQTQGETVDRNCTYTFDPYNTVYTKFRFSSSGSSFKRTVTGYIDNWYQKGETS